MCIHFAVLWIFGVVQWLERVHYIYIVLLLYIALSCPAINGALLVWKVRTSFLKNANISGNFTKNKSELTPNLFNFLTLKKMMVTATKEETLRISAFGFSSFSFSEHITFSRVFFQGVLMKRIWLTGTLACGTDQLEVSWHLEMMRVPIKHCSNCQLGNFRFKILRNWCYIEAVFILIKSFCVNNTCYSFSVVWLCLKLLP